MQDWRNMLKHAQELRLKLRNQRTARSSAPQWPRSARRRAARRSARSVRP